MLNQATTSTAQEEKLFFFVPLEGGWIIQSFIVDIYVDEDDVKDDNIVDVDDDDNDNDDDDDVKDDDNGNDNGDDDDDDGTARLFSAPDWIFSSRRGNYF